MSFHIEAKESEISKYVLMPGDPLRAKAMATHFLTNVKQINGIRNMLMFTGQYHGITITIAGSGMGCPSIAIYSWELYKFYNVQYIIRIGTSGSYSKKLKIKDIVNVTEAYVNNNFLKVYLKSRKQRIKSSPELFAVIKQTASKNNITIAQGIVRTTDFFYHPKLDKEIKKAQQNNILCVDMESGGLFTIAAYLNRCAATILTISDSLINSDLPELSSQERETTLLPMTSLALDSLVNIAQKNQ